MHVPQHDMEFYNLSRVMTGSCYFPPAVSRLLLCFKLSSFFVRQGALYECLYINYAKEASIILEIKLEDSTWGRRIRLFFYAVLTPFSLNMQIFISVCFPFPFYIIT
jgi:hypothetical protein